MKLKCLFIALAFLIPAVAFPAQYQQDQQDRQLAQHQPQPRSELTPSMHLVRTDRPIPAITYVQSLSGSQVDFIGTALMPKSHGSAKIATTRGGFKLQIHLAGLGPASQIDPAYLTYVAWAIPTNHTRAQNLGELVLKGEDATLDTFTNLTQFALIVTAEPCGIL